MVLPGPRRTVVSWCLFDIVAEVGDVLVRVGFRRSLGIAHGFGCFLA